MPFSGTLFGSGGGADPAQWTLADEVPLTLMYNGKTFGIMMVSPHDLGEFALGFTITEGIALATDIRDVRIEQAGDGFLANVIVPNLIEENADARQRILPGRTSCGICGAQTLEAALPVLPKVTGLVPDPKIGLSAVMRMPDFQHKNAEDKSSHGAAFADGDGAILEVREDVGRHNALDKLAGAMAGSGLSPKEGFLVLSSRLSVELVQKSAMIGFGFVVCVSAPTSAALKLAQNCQMRVASLAGEQLMVFGKI